MSVLRVLKLLSLNYFINKAVFIDIKFENSQLWNFQNWFPRLRLYLTDCKSSGGYPQSTSRGDIKIHDIIFILPTE